MKKIFRYKDLMGEIYEEFSEIDPKALDNIIKKGLYSMKTELRKGEELLIHAASTNIDDNYVPGWIKFYKEMTPEKYGAYIKRRDKKRKLEDANEKRTE